MCVHVREKANSSRLRSGRPVLPGAQVCPHGRTRSSTHLRITRIPRSPPPPRGQPPRAPSLCPARPFRAADAEAWARRSAVEALLPAGLSAQSSWARGAAASPERGTPGRWRRLRGAARTARKLVPEGQVAQAALPRSEPGPHTQNTWPSASQAGLSLQNASSHSCAAPTGGPGRPRARSLCGWGKPLP